MRLAASSLLLLLAASAAAAPGTIDFRVEGKDPGSWPDVLSSVGFLPANGKAGIVVLRGDAAAPAEPWLEHAEAGGFVILEGASPVAEAFGFRAGSRKVRVQNTVDERRPKLPIIWEQALEIPVFEVPPEARIFVRERHGGAPLMAGFKKGAGGVLWVAASPGERGYERFPYLLQALTDLGLSPPFRARRTWAFFDSSYRSRADLEYLAKRWRMAGIAALHVAAWHYFEPEPWRDNWLTGLIETCHRNAILVYAWLELPHVSEQFWRDHPEWREKTATLQDAHLDWRKLMNLNNRECFRAVAQGVRDLINRFDWDGINLAELYFESLEGADNASRFTPMNDDVRREFRGLHGFDPVELFRDPSARTPAKLRLFLDFRAELARRAQVEWLEQIGAIREKRPHLDLVLTHVDDRFDQGIRDAIGADAARVLPLLDRHDFTFLIEDQATIWHLGPQRYPELARRYQQLTRRTDKLGIDINVVERYQDVYPTKQQTGTELFQLVHLASQAFNRVALYFENSILPVDLPLLPAAASVVERAQRNGGRLVVESRYGTGVEWSGPVLVNGSPWPAAGGGIVWLPPGTHVLEPGGEEPALRLLDFNGDLKAAASRGGGIEFSYSSSSRAIAILNRPPTSIEIDGEEAAPAQFDAGPGRCGLYLPRGQHLVAVR
ncbi:MAG TPA: hypothetical protein PLP04_00440 [Bryobacteraceae bacterium]|nr:hypothetical protein [Bryobacteraceae bacterium]